MDLPEESSPLRCTPYSTYYSSFFLVRISVNVNEQQATVDCSSSGELTLNCHHPAIAVPFHAISTQVEAVLEKCGVSQVGNFYCEDVPLYLVSFTSEAILKGFLHDSSRLQKELASLFSAVFSETQAADPLATAVQVLPVSVQTDLFLISPDMPGKDAQIVSVTLDKCSTCWQEWKASEVFDFGSLFRTYRMHPDRSCKTGRVTLASLVSELDTVVDWFYLGTSLGVGDADLMGIKYKHKHSRDLRDIKSDLFATWLRSCTKPTWSAVVRALVSIGMEPLAKALAMKYGVCVPPSKVVGFPWHLDTSEKTSPLGKRLRGNIEKASANIATKAQKLTEVSLSLEEEEEAEVSIRKEFESIKLSIGPCRKSLARLQQQRRHNAQVLEKRHEELQALLQQQTEEIQDLKSLIDSKNKEIKDLQDSLKRLDCEIEQANERIRKLRGKLDEKTRELERKKAQVHELRKSRKELKKDLERERNRVDLLLIQRAVSDNRESYIAEVESQLSDAKKQIAAHAKRAVSDEVVLANKEAEIGQLSKKLQELEDQLQGHTATSNEDMEEQRVDEIMIQISDLRVCLAESKGEKEEMEASMEADQMQQREEQNWMEALDKTVQVSVDGLFPPELSPKCLAERVRAESTLIDRESGIYRLPSRYANAGAQIARCYVGNHSSVSVTEKVLMVVGATGTGKSTLINGMVNYLLGVCWEDSFRFKLIVEETATQAHSVMRRITAYTIYHQEGSPVPYTLTIIDTPGFGDTVGLERDRKIISQIAQFLSTPLSEGGIDQLNGIAFVTQASLARLTHTQRFVFDSVLSILGRDIGSNVFMMFTFSDGNKPPVLDAIKAEMIPHCKYFKFNNSTLFSKKQGGDDDENNADVFDTMFWKMSTKSFANFFKCFESVEPRSLTLTREVLDERRCVEITIQGLQPQIIEGLSKIDELHCEEMILKDILTSNDHKIMAGKSRVEERLKNLKSHLLTVESHVKKMIGQVRMSLEQLDKIALKPNPIGVVEYIDLLITSEQQEVKQGWQQRVKYLQGVRKQAKITAGIRSIPELEAAETKSIWESIIGWMNTN